MDAASPPPPPPSPPALYLAAAGDLYPRDGRERELCESASSPDWLYLGGLLLADVGAVYLSAYELYLSREAPVRHIGPALIGLTWGATIGGGYLALPKCSPHFVATAPREGSQRSPWPLALSLATLAGATAPFITGISTQSKDTIYDRYILWTTEERALRLIISGVTAFGGALLPYLIPPKTWRAARELEKLRVTPLQGGAFVGLSFRF